MNPPGRPPRGIAIGDEGPEEQAEIRAFNAEQKRLWLERLTAYKAQQALAALASKMGVGE